MKLKEHPLGLLSSVSPVQLTGLITEEHVNRAAGSQVLPDDGDFGAPGFGSSAGGQRQHGGDLWRTRIHSTQVTHRI